MTPQETLKATLEAIQIPHKRIEVYGSQITVTCFSRNAAEKWALVIGKFAKVRGILDTIEEAVINRNTMLRPSKVKVSRVYGRL